MIRGYLEPRHRPRDLLSRFELGCFVASASALSGMFLFADVSPGLADILGNVGVSAGGVGVGSVVRGLQWRRLFSRHAVDPHATVFHERGDYGRIVVNVSEAGEIDLAGISLLYVIEYLKDHPAEYTRRVRHTRILLPATKEICDGRDAAQGTEPGGLWAALQDSRRIMARVMAEYPSSFSLRFFAIQPYFAMTRVDGHVWVSPYVNKSGRSCPVIAVEKSRSPELFGTFTSHFEELWKQSSTIPDPT
jgi:hypothetical protein